MKNKITFFKTMILVAMALMATFLFVSCGRALNVSENIKEQMFEKEAYMIENVYGKTETIDFNTSGSANFLANTNYYVLLATNVKEDISQIKLGQVVYAKTDKAETKVSASNTLTRNVFFLNEGSLYVSNVLMFENTANDGILRIAFPKNNFKQIDVKVYESNENNLGVKANQVTPETLTTVDEMGLKYKFKIDNPNGRLFLELKDNSEVIGDTKNVLIQTVANPNKPNQTFASRYENPSFLSGSEIKGIEVNPGYNQGNAYTPDTPANHTLIYNIYVPGVGAKTVVVEFENIKS